MQISPRLFLINRNNAFFRIRYEISNMGVSEVELYFFEDANFSSNNFHEIGRQRLEASGPGELEVNLEQWGPLLDSGVFALTTFAFRGVMGDRWSWKATIFDATEQIAAAIVQVSDADNQGWKDQWMHDPRSGQRKFGTGPLGTSTFLFDVEFL